MAIFENFAKGLVKRYNRFLPKTKQHSKSQPYKVVVNFLSSIARLS